MKQKYKIVGSYFRDKRQKIGLSQYEVSMALGYASVQIVSNWGKRNVLSS